MSSYSPQIYTEQTFRLHWSKPDSQYDPKGSIYSIQFGEQFNVKCPFCHIIQPNLGPDKSYHCKITLKQNRFYCMRCGFNSHINFLLENPTREAVIKMALKRKVRINTRTLSVSKTDRDDAPVTPPRNSTYWDIPDEDRMPLTVLPEEHPVIQWLLTEFSLDDVKFLTNIYKLAYCTKGKALKNDPTNTTTHRLIIPMFDVNGVETAWQARYIPRVLTSEEEQKAMMEANEIRKYLIQPGYSKNEAPYNWHLAKYHQNVAIVEGAKKVWRTGLHATAFLGMPPSNLSLSPTSWLKDALERQIRLVIILDKGCYSKACMFAKNYRRNTGIPAIAMRLHLDGPKDLDKYSKEEIARVFERGVALLDKYGSSKPELSTSLLEQLNG